MANRVFEHAVYLPSAVSAFSRYRQEFSKVPEEEARALFDDQDEEGEALFNDEDEEDEDENDEDEEDKEERPDGEATSPARCSTVRTALGAWHTLSHTLLLPCRHHHKFVKGEEHEDEEE
jgi:hypothetical protein